jgi:hypothetical protein
MRSLLIFLALTLSGSALADIPDILCNACRSVDDYPRDYGNYAYNQVLGDHPTLSLEEGSRVKVKNPQGDWAIVDLAFVLDQTGLSLSILILSYSFIVPDGTIQIRVQDPDGETLTYEVFVESPDLRVGDGTQTGTTEPTADSTETDTVTLDKISGGTDLLGGYDASANYYGGATYPYYDIRLINE